MVCCRPKRKRASLQAVAGVAALIGLGTLGGVAVTLANGGPTALMAAIAKSGFSAAFALVFVSEIGDKVSLFLMLVVRHLVRLEPRFTTGEMLEVVQGSVKCSVVERTSTTD